MHFQASSFSSIRFFFDRLHAINAHREFRKGSEVIVNMKITGQIDIYYDRRSVNRRSVVPVANDFIAGNVCREELAVMASFLHPRRLLIVCFAKALVRSRNAWRDTRCGSTLFLRM